MKNRFRMPYLTVGLTGIGLVLSGQAAANPGQLTWSNKRPLPSSVNEAAPDAPHLDKTLPNAATGSEGFQIPPSPYGQVGNPYRRELNWTNKGKSPAPVAEQVARQVPAPQPQPKLEARAEPKPEPKVVSQPVEKPVELASNWTPAPAPRFSPKAPEIKPDIRLQAAPEPKPQPRAEPKPEPKIVAAPPVETVKKIDSPVPLPTPKPPVVTAEKLEAPAPKPELKAQPKPATDGSYQLPANSKYAGKVAPALEGKETPKAIAKVEPQPNVKPDPKTVAAAQKDVAKQADAAKTDAKKAPEKDLKLAAATASEPLAQAVEEDPYVPFVPGSRATNASQAPRYYSLHRAYGYEPDPAPHAGGELALDPTAVQTKDKPKPKDEAQKAPAASQDSAKK